jgi:streptogramin lyase
LLGFYGFTPIVQPSATNQFAVTSTAIVGPSATATTSTTPFGFSTSTQFNAMLGAVNSMVAVVNSLSVWQNQTRSDLVALGLQKGSI